MVDYNSIINKYYEPGSELYNILTRHSNSVAELALKIADAHALPLDRDEIRAGAMLHDIGIVRTDAPGIHCHGTEKYIKHGTIGAAMLRAEGLPEWVARIAERHTGAGLTAADIRAMNLPLPTDVDLVPETQLEKLICYADKFYSKSGDMQQKSLERVRLSMSKFSPETLARFEALHREFAIE
jgi:uncharacterized protein